MPSENRRIPLTMTDSLAHSFRVLGLTPTADPNDGVPADGATQVTAALARYAAAIDRAGRELEKLLKRDEWNAMADALNGCADLWEYSETPMSVLMLIRANIEDGHRLDGLGEKWFGEEEADKRIEVLLEKLTGLSLIHGDAVMTAIRYFWRHTDIDHSEARWWSVDFRTKPERINAGRS